MATASVTNTFIALTPAVAADVNTNFSDLVTFLNNSVVHLDGSKAMSSAFDAGTNKIINLTAGTAGTDAVNKTQLDSKADLASPTFTGTVVVPTATGATSPVTKAQLDALPFGKVGYASIASAQSSITGVTDLTGLTTTFTAVSGRLYRTTLHLSIDASLAGQLAGIYIRDGASSTVHVTQFYVAEASTGYGYTMSVLHTGSGSVTHKASLQRVIGSGSVGLNAAKSYILVEDIGVA